MSKIFSVLLFIIIPFISLAQNPDELTYKDEDFTNSVTLQGLNKITARVSSFEISLDETDKFGNLEISLLKCWKSPPEEEPESKALLRIWEKVPSEDKKEIFFGWMFASSPTVSALEHPVYDINVIECFNKESDKIKENGIVE